MTDQTTSPAHVAVKAAIEPQIAEGIGAILRKFCDSSEASRARDLLHKMPDSDWSTLTGMLAEECASAALRVMSAPAVPDDVADAVARAFHNLDYGDEFTAADLRAILTSHEAQAAELARLRDALDPNLTKAAYIGEISMAIPDVRENEDGEWEEYSRKIIVDWTAIKSVMQMIKTRAALTHPTGD